MPFKLNLGCCLNGKPRALYKWASPALTTARKTLSALATCTILRACGSHPYGCKNYHVCWELTSFCVILLIETPQLTLLSWRWVEGIQHISKTYLANTNKIAKYTNLVFTKTTLGLRKSTILPTTSHNRPRPTK